ncbi:DUF423 domain-containing protein [Danxiaibacter flavus]|uniref:DUF423 domain-containing protein n=1 Tax=Danxiaibacter flavus TaxID=3049108 RepID=A0ABV3ZA09_9BACT|nr:DUF423 domain-containing protein [Chitinophagaceae bacterium DXS]
MHKTFLVVAGLLGALSVALGAFGSHGLRGKVGEDVLNIFETAVKYQFYHVFALLAVSILFQSFGSGALLWSGRLFIAGTALFCGSLYLLTFFRANNNTSMNWLGAITPIGGLCFIAGWLLLVFAVIKK